MDRELSARQIKTKLEENEESTAALVKSVSYLELPLFLRNPLKWP